MQPARVSSNSSQRVLRTLQELLRRLGHPGAAASLTEHAVRKAAHFCEYSLEGFLLLLTTPGGHRTRLAVHQLARAGRPADGSDG